MTHTYQLTGMTCSGCEAKVKSHLLLVPDVTDVAVSKDNETATISMFKHVPLGELRAAVAKAGTKYHIEAGHHSEVTEQTKSWLVTYKPLLIIFAFITGLSLFGSYSTAGINWFSFMQYFMAGFFLAFSFFKLLDVKGFADSYAMYDLLAMRVKAYGLIYPFIELGLGLAYLTGFNPVFTNSATVVVMGFSSLGVIRSVMNKQKIQCACLGAVFNLPMSTVTIIEDLLMVAMALMALILGHT